LHAINWIAVEEAMRQAHGKCESFKIEAEAEFIEQAAGDAAAPQRELVHHETETSLPNSVCVEAPSSAGVRIGVANVIDGMVEEVDAPPTAQRARVAGYTEYVPPHWLII
jgi:hypothetical protein